MYKFNFTQNLFYHISNSYHIIVQGNENMMYKEEPWSGSMKKHRPPSQGGITPGTATLPYNGGGALPRYSDEDSQQSCSSSEWSLRTLEAQVQTICRAKKERVRVVPENLETQEEESAEGFGHGVGVRGRPEVDRRCGNRGETGINLEFEVWVKIVNKVSILTLMIRCLLNPYRDTICQ